MAAWEPWRKELPTKCARSPWISVLKIRKKIKMNLSQNEAFYHDENGTPDHRGEKKCSWKVIKIGRT